MKRLRSEIDLSGPGWKPETGIKFEHLEPVHIHRQRRRPRRSGFQFGWSCRFHQLLFRGKCSHSLGWCHGQLFSRAHAPELCL